MHLFDRKRIFIIFAAHTHTGLVDIEDWVGGCRE
jgi:hypothetical protein